MLLFYFGPIVALMSILTLIALLVKNRNKKDRRYYLFMKKSFIVWGLIPVIYQIVMAVLSGLIGIPSTLDLFFQILPPITGIVLIAIGLLYFPRKAKKVFLESIKSEERVPILEEKKQDLIIFVSYAIKDSQLFNVKQIAETLTLYDKIEDVLYCEEDTLDNFIKYMNENIGICDVMILFCSPNALNSEFVEDEWMAARAMRKPVIPVFIKTEHIPPLLRARNGVEFDTFNMKKNIDSLYTLVLKKTKTS